MATPLEKTIKPGEEDDRDEKGKGSPSELNSPALDEDTGKPKNLAVSTFKQAHSICKRQYELAKERIEKAAIIADKYGGSAPFKNAHLVAIGQDWRNNFSTNPLGAVVDRSTPQLSNPIKQTEYLTYSSLPADREEAADKTRNFRLKFTKLVRSWSGWTSFIGQVAQDNYLFGNAAPGWIDDDWRPRAFRHDETFLPSGTGQHASQAQFIVYRVPVLLHNFLEKLEDKEAAEMAGYDWKGCIKAANESAGLGGDESALQRVDAIRESGTLEGTYSGETKIVWMYYLLAREYAGGVNMWVTSQVGGHAIRFVEGIHETMEDATTFFTLQEGNTKFYGSRGSGRQLTNLHIALDRHRNFGADKAYLAGLPIFKVAGKDMNSVQLAVRTPFIFVNGNVEMQKEVIEFDATSHEYIDKSLSGQMEAVAGAFIPPKIDNQGSSNTKIEAAQKAERELAVKDGVLGRFFGQFSDLVSAMQRKVCKPENLKEAIRIHQENTEKKAKGIRVLARKVWEWLKQAMDMSDKSAPQEESKTADADAVQMLVDLLEDGLSPEDIVEIALSPAGNNAEEKPEEQDAKTVGFIQGIQGTTLAPFFDTRKSAQMVAEITVGEDRANRLLIPNETDPNVEAIETRNQLQEWVAMVGKMEQPVASIDNHRIHRSVMLPNLVPILQAITQAPIPEMQEFAKLAVNHYAGHVAMDTSLTPEERGAEEQQLALWESTLQNADKEISKMAEEAAKAGIPGGAGAIPAPIEGAPIASPDDKKLALEAQLRQEDQAIEHRKLDLKQQEIESKDQNETMKQAADALKTVADKAESAQRQGVQDANAEAAAEAARQNPNPSSI